MLATVWYYIEFQCVARIRAEDNEQIPTQTILLYKSHRQHKCFRIECRRMLGNVVSPRAPSFDCRTNYVVLKKKLYTMYAYLCVAHGGTLTSVIVKSGGSMCHFFNFKWKIFSFHIRKQVVNGKTQGAKATRIQKYTCCCCLVLSGESNEFVRMVE